MIGQLTIGVNAQRNVWVGPKLERLSVKGQNVKMLGVNTKYEPAHVGSCSNCFEMKFLAVDHNGS